MLLILETQSGIYVLNMHNFEVQQRKKLQELVQSNMPPFGLRFHYFMTDCLLVKIDIYDHILDERCPPSTADWILNALVIKGQSAV